MNACARKGRRKWEERGWERGREGRDGRKQISRNERGRALIPSSSSLIPNSIPPTKVSSPSFPALRGAKPGRVLGEP